MRVDWLDYFHYDFVFQVQNMHVERLFIFETCVYQLSTAIYTHREEGQKPVGNTL